MACRAFRSHTFSGALPYQKVEDGMSHLEKDDSPRKDGEHQENEDQELIPDTTPIPDTPYFLPQPSDTDENVARIVERSLSSLEPSLRTPAYCYLARTHADRGRWGEARRWCERAINQDSLAAEAYYLLALISQQEGDVGEAIANLRKVIYLGQEGPVAHFNLALLYRRQGDSSQARRSLTNAIKMLEKWPADRPLPYGEGTDSRRLLATARRLLMEFEAQ
jgi:tetratricopeptide (TPR) repeat protein